jgi:hypothetical protein
MSARIVMPERINQPTSQQASDFAGPWLTGRVDRLHINGVLPVALDQRGRWCGQ